ncbi:MAG: hypothetical protein A2651_03670 [Candidatus Yanofskybacteria bacterium RIFCSPHIGHO2_01_FULL_42_12]|uniref:YoaR-like putative peptidoglycan binding domain-containing protein n=1 Tax=Candidatus Yanofskybacteria bacterium RIFCSPLOWO2_01_FULL_42_49 TaxID=1802694 RepID=A0A1F8GFA4_9BACT|nr:MAG: hypothetical protein A2651_03670 [Candidatus Yanofskybacteria bacterium RIFCSPHIGHO2_01_FULL_42_12]OGN23408.1 MAG: hypothetical protein A2918_01725 [Candidatus Yanofskybacteria bacterium RIFCSPLOWO2_01_FULL_42_49]
MSSFSKRFLTLSSRLFIAGIIVLGGFHFGSAFYLSSIAKITTRIEVKNFADQMGADFNNNLEIRIQNYTKIVPGEIIQSWFEPYERNYSGKKDVRVLSEKVTDYLISIAPSINTQPVNAKFILVDGRAQEFLPSSYGHSLDIDKSRGLIINAVINNQTEVNLPVELIEPAITLERINELGITTLIGRGESNFKGSSQARIHNIKIGSVKHNGTILKPGEEFSFNSILGEVNEQNGFESELVIKGGKLIRELGGGLCQVSTTLFRSAIMAGLPILERRPHSFPVRYYDPQGFDATIYPGSVDLKFKNDTTNYILIQSRIEGTKLIFDIYGPDDGRKIVLEGPFQYDQKTNGSMKAYFVRKIYQGDSLVKEERFDSNYGAPAPLERNPLE